MKYKIERLGDINGITYHVTLGEAFNKLKEEYPFCNCCERRHTPDPEDDRILIWEITSDGHQKVVWHFSGWHWDFGARDVSEEDLEQGALPGDLKSLTG